MDSHRCIDARLLATCCACALLLLAGPTRAAPPLRVPWECGQVHRVSQSHHTGSHVDKGVNAWDFALPLGTAVVAPADGTVRKVRQDSTRHGCSPSYAYDANYVIIAFDDGTEALFLHMAAHSVPVSVGDRVDAGDVVGKVGMSGYTCGPHLHFQVQRTCNSWWCQSVSASFARYGDPAGGMTLTSKSCPADDNSPVIAGQGDEATPDAVHTAQHDDANADRATGGGGDDGQ